MMSRPAPEGFTKLPTLFTHCAQKTTPTNQLFPGPSARSAGPANQPPGPARVLPGSPTGQKFLRSAYSTRRTSKWVKMGYFTPLQAPRSIFSPLSILKLRHEGHSGLLDALGCQGKEPLRPLRRGRPLRECAKCGTNQPTSGGLECAEWGTTQPTQGPEWVNRVGSLVKPSGAARAQGEPNAGVRAHAGRELGALIPYGSPPAHRLGRRARSHLRAWRGRRDG